MRAKKGAEEEGQGLKGPGVLKATAIAFFPSTVALFQFLSALDLSSCSYLVAFSSPTSTSLLHAFPRILQYLPTFPPSPFLFINRPLLIFSIASFS
jgi:hypothetical protein